MFFTNDVMKLLEIVYNIIINMQERLLQIMDVPAIEKKHVDIK